jgi:hypothetical protein
MPDVNFPPDVSVAPREPSPNPPSWKRFASDEDTSRRAPETTAAAYAVLAANFRQETQNGIDIKIILRYSMRMNPRPQNVSRASFPNQTTPVPLMKILLSSLFILAAALLPASGQTVILNDSNAEDSFVDSRFPTTNYGTAVYLGLGHADGNLSVNKYIYFQFDMTGLPLEASSVTLNLYRAGGDGTAGSSVSAYVVTSPWTEGNGGNDGNTVPPATGIYYNGQPTAQGIPITSTVVNGTGAYYSFDITGVYNQWAAGDLDNYGLVFMTNGAANGEGYDFRSTEFNNDAQRPYLQITAVPEPATGAMLALGTGFVLMARRKRVA